MEIVQVISSNTSTKTVVTKSIILLEDTTQTPNYTSDDNEDAITYTYLSKE